MNQKYNYYVNKHQIFDLEYNIPLQAATNNSLMGSGVNKKLFPRKIYEDGTRSLSIETAKNFNFPHSRMDLLFWKNIVDKGENKETI
jgi:hypothetical protein